MTDIQSTAGTMTTTTLEESSNLFFNQSSPVHLCNGRFATMQIFLMVVVVVVMVKKITLQCENFTANYRHQIVLKQGHNSFGRLMDAVSRSFSCWLLRSLIHGCITTALLVPTRENRWKVWCEMVILIVIHQLNGMWRNSSLRSDRRDELIWAVNAASSVCVGANWHFNKRECWNLAPCWLVVCHRGMEKLWPGFSFFSTVSNYAFDYVVLWICLTHSSAQYTEQGCQMHFAKILS